MQKLQDNLFLLFLFILPFQTVYLWREPILGSGKWQYGVIGIYVSSLVLACAIVLGAVLKAKTLKNEPIGVRMKKMWRERKVDAFLLLFVLWSGLSILWAQDVVLAGFTFIKILLAADAFMMTRDMVRRGKMKQIVSVFFVAAVIQSVIGIGQFLMQESFSSKLLGMSAYQSWQAGTSVLKNDTGRFLRAYGSFPHPNVFGLFLAVVLLIIIERIDSFALTPQSRPHRYAKCRWRTCRIDGLSSSSLDNPPPKGEQATVNVSNDTALAWLGKTLPPSLCEGRIEEECVWKEQGFCNRIIALFGILILLLSLILSFSRLAWGGFALGFVFLAWRQYRPLRTVKDQRWRYPLAIFATIVISTAIFTGILYETVFPRFDAGVIDREVSIVGRVSTYRDAIRIIRAHPLLGVGAGNETAELIHLFPDRPIWDIQPAHDVPLLILSELGIPGCIISLCFLWSLITRIRKTNIFPSSGNTVAIAIILVLIPSILLDHFLWDSNFGLMVVFTIFGILDDSNTL